MHKMQSGGWPYVSKRLVEDIFSSCSYPLCSCLSFEDHMHAHIYRHSTPYLGYFETLNIVEALMFLCLKCMNQEQLYLHHITQTLTLTARVWLRETYITSIWQWFVCVHTNVHTRIQVPVIKLDQYSFASASPDIAGGVCSKKGIKFDYLAIEGTSNSMFHPSATMAGMVVNIRRTVLTPKWCRNFAKSFFWEETGNGINVLLH